MGEYYILLNYSYIPTRVEIPGLQPWIFQNTSLDFSNCVNTASIENYAQYMSYAQLCGTRVYKRSFVFCVAMSFQLWKLFKFTLLGARKVLVWISNFCFKEWIKEYGNCFAPHNNDNNNTSAAISTRQTINYIHKIDERRFYLKKKEKLFIKHSLLVDVIKIMALVTVTL